MAPMAAICPRCQASNPEGAAVCAECSTPIPGEIRIRVSDHTLMPTAATPRSLKEWASVQPPSGPGSGAPAAILPAGLEVGNRYRIGHLLGLGGMGAVYLARDAELDRDVALKLIRSDIAADLSALDRFKREIQLSSRVTHRNVLRVYDLGESAGIKFLTMQFVDGKDLASILKKAGKLPVPRLIKIFRQIAEGLGAAHEMGVVHRDLKPQNVLVDSLDQVYLTDFGLAKGTEQSAMTQTGAVLGTPYYMSPEQVKGLPVDSRSDLFSLGVILYEMATGTLPYSGDTPFEVMVQRTQRPPRPPREINPELPAYLCRIIERCLAIEPEARYASVTEIMADLDSASFTPTMRFRVQRWRRFVPIAAAGGITFVAAAVAWLMLNRHRPSAPAGPVKTTSVLIADFANRTGDAVFDGTLEPAFGLALEGASFVTSYNRGQARKLAEQLQPGSAGLGEPLARLVAVREGVQVVTSGSIEKAGDGYTIAVRAVDAVTGKPITEARETASGKAAVLTAVARAAADVRQALGDTTPPSVQLAAAETFSAGSLEAAHEYALAQDFQWAGKWDDAIGHYNKAVELDPNLGRAYAGLAAVESNRGRRQEAEKDYQLAIARLDRMSDREKYRTRGGYFLLTRKPDSAIEEFTALLKAYPADTAGIANLAFAYFVKRDMPKALEWGRRAIEIYPKNVPQRNNFGLIAMYAGDFQTGIQEQKTVLKMNPKFVLAYVGLALSQLGSGHPDEAKATWDTLAGIGPDGASAAASGLADLALYEGRVADAPPILEKAIEEDLAAKNVDGAARKLTTLAEAQLLSGQPARAVASADRARELSRDLAVSVSAARVWIQAGEEKRALAVASELEQKVENDPQMYAGILRGEVELRRRNLREAVLRFKEGLRQADSWLVRYDLGRAYLETGSPTEADQELEVCLKRRGEALALYLDEVPTARALPPVFYYTGRAREAMKRTDGAAQAYRTFLAAKIGAGDPMAADARRRLGAAK
jgi:tetratricopeptide (TPR) repeat protein